MEFRQYRDVNFFYRDTYDILMRDEAQNILPLGNLIIGYEGKDKTGWRDPANWFMATVLDERGVRLTALMTPSNNITLYATDNEWDADMLACLTDELIKAGVQVSGVTTENSLAMAFTGIYTEKKGMTHSVVKRLRLYELTSVNPEIPEAAIRPLRESDMSFFPYWTQGFGNDCFNTTLAVGSDPEAYRHHIRVGKTFILEDGGTPVTMARITREMRTVCGVNLVYTPPYFRGKGYATACVAALSRIILSRGYTKCALYTDLSNPTSNSIYQKIGYKPVSDSLEIKFEE